jgi:transposase
MGQKFVLKIYMIQSRYGEILIVFKMLSSDFDKLQEAYNLRGIALHQLQERVSSLEEEIQRLKEQLRLQQQRLFGKTSEASSALNPSVPVDPAEPGELGQEKFQPSKTTTVSSHVRTVPPRGKRQLDTSNLPRYSVVHDLPVHEQICLCCGGALHLIRQETSGQLEIIPVQYCVIEHVRLIYGCRPCDKVVMSPKPPAPLPKALAGPSLLTDVALNKYQYHLPLYRQSKIMKSYGVSVSDKTLANWVMASGEALLKVYEAMWVILQQRYLQVDETPVKVLETNKKGYVWAYFAPDVGKGLVAFEFSLTREGSVANKRLKTFKGLLQTDGYKGYDALRKRDDVIAFGCLSHARRKFSEVVKISKDKQGIAAEMIERMKPLYALEARLREANVHHRTRKRLRQKIARPLLNGIHTWLRSIQKSVLPKSKLGKAIFYTLKQWPYLVAYLRHGMAEIDTNYVENKIRDIALGKKNWLVIGNEDCGKIHALWYTLIISAIINELNPRVYIHYLLTKVHDLRQKTIDPLTLLPDRIDLKELESFAVKQVEFGRKILNNLNSS